ncbi:hypothetical protein IV203_031792 [Nitzschia inconspicua]|uniref:Uncharacterized protein n=1 Tax=Nitzschia inconspicua TaxID=303405 RepID=A0A9K3LUZ4_9STRA|nr:hypothetical protein IV203_031792 [Nitzschia inconspicua]
MVTILSVQVVWLKKSNSRDDKKKGSMDSNVKSSRKVVQTPAFDSSKLDQIRQKKRVAMREKSRADNLPPSDGVIPKAPSLAEFPQWIQDYVQWHAQQRQLYPDMELFQNPNAPKLLIRTCLGICGGLHDRIGQLPWDLYLAAKTKRLLLVAWQRPKELENFLLPNELSKGEAGDANTIMLDWSVPIDAHFGFNDIKSVRNYTQLFDGYPEDHPDDDFWETQVDLALDRAISGEFSNIRILRHRLLGHLNEGVLEQRLRDEGWYENDKKHQPEQLHVAPTFGKIFHLFFRPSPAVYDEIKTVLHMLQLTPNQYTAVHCRVRHPKAHEAGSVVKGKNAKYPADKTGLPWDEGHPLREFACQTATTALQCARDIAKEDTTSSIQTISSLPIYFLADSNDLVRHVSLELQDTKGYLQTNKTGIYQPLLNEVQATPHRRIVARDVTLENAHIDRQKGRDPPAYFGTFVDLYLALQARCVVYGIGYYAAFAAKISGTTCSYLYAQEAWGSQVSKQAHICPNTVHEN